VLVVVRKGMQDQAVSTATHVIRVVNQVILLKHVEAKRHS
jgi:hypothetical protein